LAQACKISSSEEDASGGVKQKVDIASVVVMKVESKNPSSEDLPNQEKNRG